MISEITFLATEKTVNTVTVGIFPSSGRYFRKAMESKDGIFYHTSVDLPAGKSFYQVFINDEFEKPLADLPGLISDSDPLKRVLINNETDIFCPVIFKEKENAIHVAGRGCYINLVTLHQFISQIGYINAKGKKRIFNLSHQYKNRKYWHLFLEEELVEAPYLIELGSDQSIGYLSNDGIISSTPDFNKSFRFDKGNGNDITHGLNIGYQIFPDRFDIVGNKSADCLKWGEKPGYFTFFGGNFKGILKHLDHFSDLGVDFVYLNPVFKAENSHRYDVEDYLQIDPILGDGQEFKLVVDELHQSNIKVILDIPLNHCGVGFFAFQDLLINQRNSIYKDWFEVFRFPVDISDNLAYSCWSGYKEYPQFNHENDEVLEYFKTVSRHWIKNYHIDGWRLDSCSEISHDFLAKFVDYSRSLKEDLFFVGEDWHNELQILEDGVNGITNYSLYWDVILPYFQRNGSVSQLAHNIMEIFYQQTPIKRRSCWNFLSNHDIARFSSLVKDEKEVILAFNLMSFLPGIPVIYYGEEFNLQGSQDPENRGCMDWSQLENSIETISEINRMTSVRRKYSEVFQFGSLEIPYLDSEREILIIKRKKQNQTLLLICNFSDIRQTIDKSILEDRQTLSDALTDIPVMRTIALDPKSTLILIAQ